MCTHFLNSKNRCANMIHKKGAGMYKSWRNTEKLPIEAREDKKPFNIFIPTTTVELGAGNGCQNRHKTLQSKVTANIFMSHAYREKGLVVYT